jgi:hypothetical protein
MLKSWGMPEIFTIKETIGGRKTMDRIDRSKIEEVPIIDAGQIWKINYLRQLREARTTGKPLSEIIDADKGQLESIRIQARIRKELKGI